MSDTYAFDYRAECPLNARESLYANATLTDQARLVEVASVFALYNPPASGYAVTLLDLNVTSLDGGVQLGTPTPALLEVKSITALSGGASITPVALDSASASLPSQVLVRFRPGAVTAGNALRRRPTDLQVANLGTQPYQTQYQLGGTNPTGPTGSCTLLGGSFSETQAITLREGEGILIDTANSLTAGSKTELHATIWVRNQASGAQYIVSRHMPVESDVSAGLLGIFNGAGSGVVLEVNRADFTNTHVYHTTSFQEWCSLESCVYAHGGLPVTPVPMDTTSPSLPSSIVLAQRAVVSQVGPDLYGFESRDTLAGDRPFRRTLWNGCVTQGIAVLPGCNIKSRRFGGIVAPQSVNGDGSVQGIVLRAGEGVCLLKQCWGSLFVQWALNARFHVSGLLTYEVDPVHVTQPTGQVHLVS